MPIQVSSEAFGPLTDEGVYEGTGFAVVSASPQEAVVAALTAVSRRWFYVTETGEDLSDLDFQAFEPALERLRDAQGREDWDIPYTPNWVSDVHFGPSGPQIVADCKGEMSVAMAETVLRVLREELQRAGIEDAEVVACSAV